MVDIKELREMIKSIDQEIIELIATRMEITDELAEAKKANNQDAWDASVEKEIIARYKMLCDEVSLSDEEAEHIAEVILKISRERQKKHFK